MKASLIFKMSSKNAKQMVRPKPRKVRARKAATKAPRPVAIVRTPRKRANRQGNGVRTRNLPVSNNMKRFTIPIDEQITLVSGNNGAFAAGVLTYALNPGNPLIFPFTSRTAQNYERYEFQDLMFSYRPSASVFATVGAQGFVGISASDDALQAPPSSQQIAEVFLHSPVVETAKPTNLRLRKVFMESSSKQMHFVRPNGLLPGGSDAHMYDCGQIFFWCDGQANTNQIGELRVTGRCLLSNPVLEVSTTPPTNNSISSFSSTAVASSATTVAANVLAATVINNGLPVLNVAGIFTPPVGNYQVTVNMVLEQTVTGAAIQFALQAQKNGANLTNVPGMANGVPGVATQISDAFVSLTTFVNANGADTFQFVYTPTYTAGAPVYNAIVTWQIV